MEIIYTFGSNCLFSRMKKYEKIRAMMQSKVKGSQDPTKHLDGMASHKYKKMSEILNELFSIRAKMDDKIGARDLMS